LYPRSLHQITGILFPVPPALNATEDITLTSIFSGALPLGIGSLDFGTLLTFLSNPFFIGLTEVNFNIFFQWQVEQKGQKTPKNGLKKWVKMSQKFLFAC
jgi:hypothetical protein